ncbi:LppX_LprAFG lipoprotein [Glycomyces terrestris]|uniref:LppX_LprAFG lipoprotein n=1 Tax=Glycomyces terrestris TaxID=2493553 RepID=A0A426UXG2_9ACTN|nr:LppX_LprAFG lipoprotein [Glycomyces terrestris]RRR99198.1 LppX_LprAFG lipoprotein [Glycomyces terrestris]
MRSRHPLTGAALAACALLAACSGGADDLPPADEALPSAAAAMAAAESVHFELTVDGDVEGLAVERADGVVTADGEAEGAGVITALGMDLEIDYTIVGDSAYVKGATGGYQEIPVGDEMLPYDPTVLLDPDRGVAALLDAVESATPEDAETIDGVATYRYEVVFDPAAFAEFLPAAGDWNTATVWFDQERLRVVRAEFAQGDATVALAFDDYDEPVEIVAPQ